jgi:hypothetical protein
MARIFDPTMGDGSILVASFDGQTPTREVAANWEQERADFEREQELRSIHRTMTERTSVCG